MKGSRDMSVAVLLALAVVLAAAVSFAYRTKGGPLPPKERIIAIFKTGDPQNEFWSTVGEGVATAAADFNFSVSMRSPREEIQVDEQIAIFDAAVSERPAAIILAACDVDRLVEPVRRARAAGIRVVCVDSFIATDDAEAKVGTDNAEAGRKCGEALLRALPVGGKVAVMSYVKGSSTAIGRESGLSSAIAGRLTVSGTYYSGSDREQAYVQAKAIIASESPPDAIAALNQPTAAGAARALEESGRKDDIVLVGFDNSFEIIKFVERGIIRSTIVQNPFSMGYIAVRTASELIGGKKPPKFINTGSLDVNRGNMFEPANQKLLFPVTMP